MSRMVHYDLVVLGGGPGGYTAAFRAADLGLSVALVERHAELGGVCLNVGCIPSKMLLHSAAVIREAERLRDQGIAFGEPAINLERLRQAKADTIERLGSGLAGLARRRGVTRITGHAGFRSPTQVTVATDDGEVTLEFDKAVIAVGSRPIMPGFLPDTPRVLDSTDALALSTVPESLLVIGGGVIGLEMTSIFSALGSRVTVVERDAAMLPGCDSDLVDPLTAQLAASGVDLRTGHEVVAMEDVSDGLTVELSGPSGSSTERFSHALCAVGREPNSDNIQLGNAGIEPDQNGFIAIDFQQRTAVSHIFSIGDVTGQPMLAHRASHQGKVAAEVAAGMVVADDAQVMPSVVYTEPEVAWAGLTETEAVQSGRPVRVAKFPWQASGRAQAVGATAGMTKWVVCAQTDALLGAGIVGANAGEMIGEACLAIETALEATDVSLVVHPHPTLSESLPLAAAIHDGSITEL